MKNKSIIIGVVFILIVSGITIYLSFDKITIFVISKLYNLDISYKSLNKSSIDGFVFENLKVLNRPMALGFFSSKATLKPVWKANFLKTANFDFKFKDVHFIKGREEGPKAKYDTLTQLVAIPFEGRWTYKEIAGVVEIFSNGLTLKRFSANGREIRLTLSGDIFYNNVVDAEISIYFSKDVLKDIPPELHSVIMRDEPDEWKSFSVKLKGDLKSPSIQVSGKLFRLNIGTMVMN